MVDDLLMLARSDEPTTDIINTAVDLDDIVFAEAARNRPIPIDTAGVSAGRVVARPADLARIVGHLLDNAARHATTKVAVGLRTHGPIVELWVDDDGDGVASNDRERIFERFSRLKEARTRDLGGAGLGLAVVASSVTGMGGTVEVLDSPLGGARFLAHLPSAH